MKNQENLSMKPKNTLKMRGKNGRPQKNFVKIEAKNFLIQDEYDLGIKKRRKMKNSGNLVDILQDVIRRREIPRENIRSAQWFQSKIRNFRRSLNVRLDDTSMTSDQFIEKSTLVRPSNINKAKLTMFSYK